MIISTTLAFLTVGLAQQGVSQAPLTCPVTGTNVDVNAPAMDYKGVRYGFCCGNCPAGFQKDPDAAINSDKAKGKTIGTFLFDPISGNRITSEKAKASSDYKGVRYLFASDDEKKSFDESPDKFTATPDKESLYCVVQKTKISSYAAAGSFKDYEGVRYYFCCGACPLDFNKKPAIYAKDAKDFVSTPKAMTAPAEKKQEKSDDGAVAFTPVTFACKHCGRPMTMNSADDANTVCSACNCGKKMSQCKG